jgi:bud site selection protein 20
MGRVPGSKNKANKNKQYKKASRTRCRNRDIDQIQDDLEKEKMHDAKMSFEVDDDLTGLGQHYCIHCARHFADEITLDRHKGTKAHKRRLKDVKGEKYTQDVADFGAGKTKEILPPAHPNKDD